MPLRGCGNDAERVAALLAAPSCGFDVEIIRNGEATRANLKKQIQNWLFIEADVSVLYFAGHGERTSVSTFLLTSDTTEGDEGIDIQWITKATNSLCKPDQTAIIILDCCHSGDATPRDGNTQFSAMTIADVPSISGQGRVVMAACRGTESAVECTFAGHIHGLFSHNLCLAIEGFAADESGLVTVNSAFDYIHGQLKVAGHQVPVLKGDQQGSIFLATGVSKQGSWAPANRSKLSLADAVSVADEMLEQMHHAMQEGSRIAWNEHGFADACRILAPILRWFQRRSDSQPDLLKSEDFKERYDSAQHYLKLLCAVKEGIRIPEGAVSKKVGGGSFGIVWRVSSTDWIQPVCFKSFHSHDLDDREKVARFKRGFDAMQQLDHPNIVKVLKLAELPFGFFMEFIEGPNLRTFSPSGTLEAEQVVDLLIGIAETLKHAHGRGVIHRDVKPENILVRYKNDGSVEPFLTDFDLAWFKSATQVTQLSGFGSHFYAAPEQMDSPTSAHETSVDTYSFGQLCFFSICGRDPNAITTENNAKTLSSALSRWPDAEASKQMLQLFIECTKMRPKERLQDFRLISEKLAEIRANLSRTTADYEIDKFLEQVRFMLGGDLSARPIEYQSTTLRSRSGRTEISIIVKKDAAEVCGLDVTVRPNELFLDGLNAASTKSIILQRIDTMLRSFEEKHSTVRKAANSGSFEFTVRIDHLTKNMQGVLAAREIVSRLIDILEQA